jgi:hypothetical protein
MKALGLQDTRIVDFRADKQYVVPGETVTFTGKLQGHNVFCGWDPVVNDTVHLVVNENRVAQATTGDQGGFTFRWAPRDLGTYYCRVEYDGTWWWNPCRSQEIAILCVTEEEKERREAEERAEQERFWLIVGLCAAAGIATVIGTAIYLEEERRRERLMLLMMK